jgi:hypothetical protein
MKFSHKEIDDLFVGTTFGMEYDCGGFDRHRSLPTPHKWCQDEVCAHSNYGVGNDPKLKFSMWGGEVQFHPQSSEESLHKEVLDVINTCMPDPSLKHIGTIHMHVRVPSLLEQPELVRYLVRWFNIWNPRFNELIWKWDFHDILNLPKKAQRYYKWLEDRHIAAKGQIYGNDSLARMDALNTDSVADIALALHNHPKDWKNEWTDLGKINKVRRPNINFGHLAITETIEFRCFMATTDEAILRNIIAFPLNTIRAALSNDKDPLRVCRGVTYQDNFSTIFEGDTEKKLIVASETTGYFNNRKYIADKIRAMLISKTLDLSELNYPQHWIDEGFN